MSFMDFVKAAFLLPFKLIKLFALFLFKEKVLKRVEGADFSDPRQARDYLNAKHTGLLLDGEKLKLSEPASFQNVCVIARVGAGKTSRYIVPNVLARAKQKCSLVINDPKGEVYELTSGYLKARGYRILAIDPEHPERSQGFNPLLEAHSDIELEQIAEILVKCGNPEDKSSFWNNGATRFVSVFLQCLANAGKENPAYNTLANLYYLFQSFGTDGAKLDNWMARYTIDPDHPEDRRLWNEWQGVLTGNEQGVQSFVLNAITALKAMSNQNLAKLTAESGFELSQMRHQKTAIFLITPPQHAEYYSFLTSVFFRSVFNACMRQLPSKKELPVYVFYDEFGHSTIPNFVSVANTIRGYRVSLSIVLQSISQLNARYGRDYAYSIQGGFNTYLTYSGGDIETTQFFERQIGKQRITQLPQSEHNLTEHYREQNLMNANEIRTIADDEVLIISANRNPLLIPSKPFFKQWAARKQTSYPVPATSHRTPSPLTYLDLS